MNNNTNAPSFGFAGYHPAVGLVYFSLTLGFTMFSMNPICLGMSCLGALSYCICLRGRKAARFCLMAVLPMMLLAALVNPAFNHEGITVLTYLPDGNPLTLESILYGLASALMLAAALLWFVCVSEVMTSDKLIYLFGQIIPALSLVLSMTLRFIPQLKARFAAAAEAQRGLGRPDGGGLRNKLRNAARIFSIVLTWSLEGALATADSMKSRGYGLPGRSAYSIWQIGGRDGGMLAWLGFCGVYTFSGMLSGGLYWRWFPSVKWAEPGVFQYSFYLVYLALCLTPAIIDFMEGREWKRSKSAV